MKFSSCLISDDLFIDPNYKSSNIITYNLVAINSSRVEISLPEFISFDPAKNLASYNPPKLDADYISELDIYQRIYVLRLIATKSVGVSGFYDFTLRVMNRRPIVNITISNQFRRFIFETGNEFSLTLLHETFIDPDNH
jgi:hypothetical protein